MPEGHTLHRLATALDDAFAGQPVRVSSPQGRFAESAALLDGRVLEGAEAWGKHLFVALRAGRPRPRPPRPVRQVRRAPRRRRACRRRSARSGCGWSGPTARRRRVVRRPARRHRLRAADPRAARRAGRPARARTRCGRTPTRTWPGQRIRRSRAPIGGLLMDQSVLAGIGNVYRAELLFRHRMDPFRPGTTLRAGRWQAMWEDLVDADGRRRAHRPDRHGPARAPHRGRSARPPVPAARRLLRLPPRRRAVPGLRDPGPHP